MNKTIKESPITVERSSIVQSITFHSNCHSMVTRHLNLWLHMRVHVGLSRVHWNGQLISHSS